VLDNLFPFVAPFKILMYNKDLAVLNAKSRFCLIKRDQTDNTWFLKIAP